MQAPSLSLTCARCDSTSPPEAKYCLQCGKAFPVPAAPFSKWIIWPGIVLVSLSLLFASIYNVYYKPTPIKPSIKTEKLLSDQQQAEAQAMKDKTCHTVERLRSAGAFTKIEPGYSGVTHAYVDREFFSIPIDAKETVLKAVALCYVDLNKKDQPGLVIIHNGYSGKQIGTYDFVSGLEME